MIYGAGELDQIASFSEDREGRHFDRGPGSDSDAASVLLAGIALAAAFFFA